MREKPKFKKGEIVCIRGRVAPAGLAVVCRQSVESSQHFLVNAVKEKGDTISTFHFHQSELRPLTKKERGQ